MMALRVPRFLQRSEWGLVAAIVVVLALTAALDSDHIYLKDPGPSAKDIVRQTVMLGIFALGAAVVIISGGIDLSAGSMIAFSGTVCAATLHLLAPTLVRAYQPFPVWVIAVAVGASLLSGVLVGSLHAWLITVIRLPPFIATLATLVGLRSLSRALVAYFNGGSTQIPIPNENFRALANELWIPATLCVLLTLGVWLMMSRTVIGRHLYALGGNESAARLSGIQTDRLKWLAYCTSAVLSAVAGILYIAQVAGVEPESLGKGYELNAIAAAVVGGCSLQGGVGSVPGTLLGALFLRVVMDGVAKIIKTSADVYEGLIVGTVVVVAVALTQLRRAGQGGAHFFAGAMGWVTMVNLALFAGVLTALVQKDSSWIPLLAVKLGAPGAPGPDDSWRGLLTAAGVAAAVFVLLVGVRLREGRRREQKA
jgi:ribose/xylose/arabinose/galactoside ABC-type transport system permease subunit